MGLRIGIIGAASVSHGRRLLNDLFTYPWIDKTTLSLMAPHMHHLNGVAEFARRIATRNGLATAVESSTDVAGAITEADVLFLLYDAGGFGTFDQDFQLARKYGIDLCIGDTMGPPGIMKAVRNVSVLQEIAKEVRVFSPECLVVNYVNPMAIMTISAKELGIRNFVGICGGVESTRKRIAACLELPVESLTTQFAGINHMTWATEIRSGGEDLYPLFRKRMTLPEWTESEPTRAEVLQHFGYFVTETSGHLSDFFPWFRRDPEVRRRYCSGSGYSGASGAYHRFASYVHRRLHNVDPFAYETGELEPRSEDYGARIANAWITGDGYDFYGNLPNGSNLIANLPADAAVEVPAHVAQRCLRGKAIGELPLQLAGLCNTNIVVQRIATQASLTKNPRLLLAALSLDPLTAATIDLPTSRRLAEELIAANSAWFPKLEAGFSFDSVPIQSNRRTQVLPPDDDDVLEPVRRFDRLRRKANA